MYFKEYYNCYFRLVPPHADGTTIEVAPDHFVPWLGTIDRRIARRLPGAKQVALKFAGWRVNETDAWCWLTGAQCVVGCWTEEGVMAVINGRAPLLKNGRPSASR